MIVVCPECSAKFNLPDETLEGDGRTLRCSKCKNEWIQTLDGVKEIPAVEDMPVEQNDAPEEQGEDHEPIPESVKPRYQTELDAEDLMGKGTASGEAFDEQSIEYSRKAVVGLFAVMMAGVLCVLVLFRGTVVAAWEPSALLFDTLGINVPEFAHGLELKYVVVTSEDDPQYGKFLRVECYVHNFSDEEMQFPPLSVSLYDKQGNLLQDAFPTVPDKMIKPDDDEEFSFGIPDPDPNGVQVQVTFVEDEEGHDKILASGKLLGSHTKTEIKKTGNTDHDRHH